MKKPRPKDGPPRLGDLPMNAAPTAGPEATALEGTVAMLPGEAYGPPSEGQENPSFHFLPDGTITFVSEEYCSALGRGPLELLGKRLPILVPEEDRSALESLLAGFRGALPAGDFLSDLDWRVTTAEGRLLRQAASIRSIVDSEGRPALEVICRSAATIQDSEESLETEYGYFRDLFENLKQVLWIRTPERMIYVNPAYEEIWGGDRSHLYSNPDSFLESVHPEDRERVRRALSVEAFSGQFDEDYRIIRPDGTERWVHARSFPVFRDGVIQRTVGVADDITERKRIEQSLRMENSFRNALIERAAEGICVCHAIEEHPYVRFTVWNERMLALTGYSLDEINQYGWYQTLYPDPEMRERARRRMEMMRDGDDLRNEEWEITRADGKKATISISTSLLVSDDGKPHVLALMHDATDQREVREQLEEHVRRRTLQLVQLNESLQKEIEERIEVERSLRRSESLLREAQALAHIGSFSADFDTKQFWWSEELYRLLGYSPGEVQPGMDLLVSRIDPEDRAAFKREIADAVRQGRSIALELRYAPRGGETRLAHLCVSVDYGADGRPTSHYGTLHDITEIKAAEQALRSANLDLENEVALRTRELAQKAQNLEEMNSALKVLLQKRDEHREEIEESVAANIKHHLKPLLNELKKFNLPEPQLDVLNRIDLQIGSITSSFIRKLSRNVTELTPMEIKVAEMIREGLQTKEIAARMALAPSTVLFHRENLRKKLGLTGRKANLRSYLQTFD